MFGVWYNCKPLVLQSNWRREGYESLAIIMIIIIEYVSDLCVVVDCSKNDIAGFPYGHG